MVAAHSGTRADRESRDRLPRVLLWALLVVPRQVRAIGRKLADAAIECINCGVCYAACDVVSWDKDYLGPAALNRAWTLVNDERHADPKGVLRQATTDGGASCCHTQGNCMTHCPVELSPTGSIAGLKRKAVLGFFRRG